MARKVLLALVLLLAFVSFALGALRFFDASHNRFMIEKLPPPDHVSGQPTLPVNGHITQTPRPAETFNFPIALDDTGPMHPLYAGTLHYPFYCMTWESGLGQPIVDNQDGIGVPVYAEDAAGELTETVIGYSKDCRVNTRLDYFYINQNGKHKPYTDSTQASDIKQLTVKGEQVPFIIRVERGTINRYIYVIAMLVGDKANHHIGNTNYWNQRLVFQFGGGSGIGYRQGKLNLRKVLQRRADQLAEGYAVIGSTGNITSYTYNMLLAEDTAVRVKRQFVARYGEPLYTVAAGGSGGAIQQYLIAQNRPGVLDGIIPQYGYPDMLSQTIYAMDCDLLEHYFNITGSDNPNWQDWDYREPVVGLNHLKGFEPKYAWLRQLNQMLEGVYPYDADGSNECINGWFTQTTLVNNPRQGYLKPYYSDKVQEQVNWTYWQDLAQLHGTDEAGFAKSTWDNVGVQYGLIPFVQGKISAEEFIDLNRRIGGWKSQSQMQPERFFRVLTSRFPVWTSMWSRHNISTGARLSGDLQAIENAYRYGQVFIGKVDIPVIDVRHYLEDRLDMHHTSASFSARVRMAEQNTAQNQLIWMSEKPYDYTNKAFKVLDQWLLNIRQNPDKTIAQNKPDQAVDQCANGKGQIVAQGDGVWHGQWNGKPSGQCLQQYPTYPNSRIQAGDNWSTSVFKCHLQSIDEALARGVYGSVDISAIRAELEAIFPQGVCHYPAGDLGRPPDL